MENINLKSANTDKISNLRSICDELLIKLSCVQKELYGIRKCLIDTQDYIDNI